MYKSTPDKLYHGSNRIFNKFDLDQIGSNVGTSGASIGFYFTTSIEEALSYGKYVYVVDFSSLKLKKPLSNFKRTLTNVQIEKILDNILIETEGDDNYYENYDDYSWEDFKNKRNTVLKKKIIKDIYESFIGWNDTEIIASFNNAGLGTQTIFKILDKLGYNYTMDQYDDSVFKNSQHYVLYFEPKIVERLTFKNTEALQEYKTKFIKKSK